jgi:hypothetical protein
MLIQQFKHEICTYLEAGHSFESAKEAVRADLLRDAESLLENDIGLDIATDVQDNTRVERTIPEEITEDTKHVLADIIPEFDEGFKHISTAEGGYSWQPRDNGGETYAGITRKNWPKWKGWSFIDGRKRVGSGPEIISFNWTDTRGTGMAPVKNRRQIARHTKYPQLDQAVKDFYKENYWDKKGFSSIKDQNAANFCFDFCMNSGTTGEKVINQSLKKLGATNLPNITFNSRTVTGLNYLMEIYGPIKLVNDLIKYRIEYIEEISARKSQSGFRSHWVKRLKAFKDGGT